MTKNSPSISLPRFKLSFLNKKQIFLLKSVVVFFLILAITSLVPLIPFAVKATIGKASPYTIRAPYSLSYESEVLTQEEQEKALEEISVPLKTNWNIGLLQKTRLENTLEKISFYQQADYSLEEKVSTLQEKITTLNLTKSLIQDILALSPQRWAYATGETIRVFESIQNRGIQDKQLEIYKGVVYNKIEETFTEKEKQIIANLVSPFLVVNTYPDEEKLNQIKENLLEEIGQVSNQITKGEMIVKKGEPFSPLQVEELEKLGLTRSKLDYGIIFRKLFIYAIFSGLLFFFINRFVPSLKENRKGLIFYLSALLICNIIIFNLIPAHPNIFYIIPLAAFTILFGLLVNGNAGIFFMASLILFVSLSYGDTADLILFTLLSNLTAFIGIKDTAKIEEYLHRAIYLSLINSFLIILFAFSARILTTNIVFKNLVIGFANGFMSVFLLILGLSFLSSMFGKLSSFQLLELTNSDHPLLKLLSEKAPGTYHHALTTAELAKEAASRIGADPLLAKTLALYHDIGKIEAPNLFIENQKNEENPHDKLTPESSAQKIASHVENGLTLADYYHLPQPIRKGIQTHHGNSLIQSFYKKALARELMPLKEKKKKKAQLAMGFEELEKPFSMKPTVSLINESTFRYPGPCPHSKEETILMLADSVEAGARSQKREKESLHLGEFVNQVVERKIGEDQLRNSCLTLRDIEKIKDAFISVLEGIYHERNIETPQKEEQPSANEEKTEQEETPTPEKEENELEKSTEPESENDLRD